MTVLKTASKVYKGASPAAKAYAGSAVAWAPPGGGGGVPWTPADLGADLLVWLDASDVATVTVAGSGVSQWSDKSSNALHGIQTNDGFRAPYVSGSKIAFAAQQHLVLSGYPVVYDYILVGKPQWDGNYRIAMWGGNGAGLMLDPSSLLGIWSYSGFSNSGPTWTTGTDGLVYGSISNSVNSQLAFNGGSLASAGHPVELSQPTSICRDNYGQPFGDIYELIFVTYASPVATKQKLEGYVAHKWELQALLPAGHPWKAGPP